MTWVIWFYGKIMIRPVGNSYLVQERFLSIHKEGVGNLINSGTITLIIATEYSTAVKNEHNE